jgi:hypothetical protein
MPSHQWGDTWFEEHGDKLDIAISYIMRTWKTYGRIGTHGKEKYGTFRDHPYFWDGGLHSLLYPGYVWIKWPLLYNFDWHVTKPFTKYTGLHKLGLWYQKQVYNFAIQRMCKIYPEITDELVSSLDGIEFVKPGIFGNVCGKTIHDKYWTTF